MSSEVFEQAKRLDGRLDLITPWIDYDPKEDCATVRLDGEFSAADLRAIATHMEQHGAPLSVDTTTGKP